MIETLYDIGKTTAYCIAFAGAPIAVLALIEPAILIHVGEFIAAMIGLN